MPELPEVTTTVNALQKVLPKLKIISVWTDLAKNNQHIKHYKDTLKDAKFFEYFKKNTVGVKVINVERRAKNILVNLSNKHTIIMHLKMTGHLLYGKYIYDKKENKWSPDPKERKSLFESFNKYIHIVFSLSNKKQLVFCDARKFGKVTLVKTVDLNKTIHLKNIGPEPLSKSFTLSNFKERLMLKPSWKIKTVLVDQGVIAGIGNIYSDEMLWLAGIHPESHPRKIPDDKIKKLYEAMIEVLTNGINFGGDSMSDYRNIDGEKGDFQNHHNVYQKKNTKCMKSGCKGVIIRKVINGRSAHFCDTHQKLFN
ncbi:MAG TPA: bifunctional DNA-formamidopyrimidine glycosylase/DNA-(apurinic or apyrimidinic site) lyase [Candidatus Paceibacterota bacterium]|nr:bifunctional DNA-formamidopyrimidine glycosylase/DNA-(apurinic or apyrimidinic site) lyase [Candidatus Paceibacterota bacterium]